MYGKQSSFITQLPLDDSLGMLHVVPINEKKEEKKTKVENVKQSIRNKHEHPESDTNETTNVNV